MTLNRYAARRDLNEPSIVQALQAVGAFVYPLKKPVDLLVGFRSTWHILEVKNPTGRNRIESDQQDFIRHALGVACPVHVVRSAEEALTAIGATP